MFVTKFCLISFLIFQVSSNKQTTVNTVKTVNKQFINKNSDPGTYYGNEFEEFIRKYNKTYLHESEMEHRKKVFYQNLDHANELNYKSGTKAFGITELMDMTTEEFLKTYAGGLNLALMEPVSETLQIELTNEVQEMDKFDWRDKGVVAPVGNQGVCGCCWAFSAVGCVESQFAKKFGKMIPLSQEQLVDCYGGCDGNVPHLAMNYAANQMGGFMSEAEYAFEASEGIARECRFRSNGIQVTLFGGKRVRILTEWELKQLVVEYGPVSVGIHVTHAWMKYTGNITDGWTLGCYNTQQINHAVLLVGFGIENKVPYWVIKNSWGENWGDQGYLKLKMGENACNILEYAAQAML